MCVGLLVVRLLYRLYVCVLLSKWFTFCFGFGRLVNVRSVALPLAITVKCTRRADEWRYVRVHSVVR